jgi:hypothetical protein
MLAVAFLNLLSNFCLICVAFFLFLKRRKHSSNQSDVSKTFHEVQLFGVPDTFWIQTCWLGDYLLTASSMSLWSNCVMKNIFALGVGLQFI